MKDVSAAELRQLGEESLAMVALSRGQAIAIANRLVMLEPQPIETAPKTPDDFSESHYLLGWCPDKDVPGGGDWRVVYWEPKMPRGRSRGLGIWYGDRDVEEHPTHWVRLPPPLNSYSKTDPIWASARKCAAAERLYAALSRAVEHQDPLQCSPWIAEALTALADARGDA